ncbi:MAG: TonB-dependent receptor [Acidobacteriaceae bacterium]|nr:TonB-dependent receptor [Acidobacteriaceae bacterium]
METESSDLGAVIDRRMIENLPLNERDFLQLALLTPGVLPPVQDSALSTRGDFAMNANGGREEFNDYLLDGVDNNDPDVNTYVLQPSVDAIQEFKIETNAYSAEYGRSAGAQVNVITRSGTNDWHGFAYEYLRNRVLDARNFFDGPDKPQLIRSQFGGGIGGPVVRDKTFLFFDYDGLRGNQGFSRLATVPTIAERSGDLSGLSPAFDPITGQLLGTHIPPSLISPVARKILELYPLPTNNLTIGNYLAQPVGTDALDQYNVRFDHRFNDFNQLTLRYSYGHKDIFEPYTENSITNVPGFGDYVRDRGHNALINYTRVLTPNTTNSFLLGFNRAGRTILQQNYQTNVNQLWSVSYFPDTSVDFGYPSISVSGFSSLGDLVALPIDRHTTTYQLDDTIAFVRDNHAIKIGAQFRKLELNGFVSQYPRGSISFLGALSGSGIGDLLLGLPTFTLDAALSAPQTLRTFQSNFYAQDDWKIRPDLTLNIGLRYEYNTPPTDPTNRMEALNLATGMLSRVGTNGIPRSGFEPDYLDFAPRFGFAWNPEKNLVIRGGYGVFYDAGMFETSSALYFNPPYFSLYTFFPSAAGLLTLQNPFPTNLGYIPPAALSTLAPDIRTPYVQDWHIDVQRSIQGLGTLSVAYAASKGTKLIRSLDLNQPSPAPGDVDARRPFQGFSNIFYTESGGDSEFNALQISFNRRLRSGLAILANYMFSKSMDDTSAYLGTIADTNFPQNSHDYHAEHAVSSFDVTHAATIAFVYQLPFRNVFIRTTEFRSILSAYTGQPFTPLISFDNSNTGNTGNPFGSDRPNVLRSPALTNPGPQKWFDTAAFSVPVPYSFGDAGRNILRGPGQFTWDIEGARRFLLTESWSLTFEAQAFNVLNRTNFDLPQLYVDQPGFGRIFSAKTPRQLQLAVRFSF